jgi:hypothetical protein
MRHLTDDEIQNYLQSGVSGRFSHLEDHLSICGDCQKQLLLYERLEELAHFIPSKPIPKAFEKNVMQRLNYFHRQRRITDLIAAIIIFVGILSINAVILLMPQVRDIFADYSNKAWHNVIQLSSERGLTAKTIAVPILGIILLMLFAMVDRKIATNLKTSNNTQA